MSKSGAVNTASLEEEIKVGSSYFLQDYRALYIPLIGEILCNVYVLSII